MTQTQVQQGAGKKPIYKRGWFIAVAVVMGLGVIGRAERGERGGGRSTATTASVGMSGERADPALAAAGGRAVGAETGAAGHEDAAGDGRAVGEAGAAASGGAGGDSAGAGAVAAVEEDEGERWRYSKTEDVMTGQVTRTARVLSTNSHELGFPYQGGTFADVTIRRHPRHGVDVLVSVNRGQISCSSFRGCRVMVRFDEREPIKFKGAEPSDFDSTMVFVVPAAKFIKEAKRAKTAAVELEFFQEGTRVFLFDVEGLVWE